MGADCVGSVLWKKCLCQKGSCAHNGQCIPSSPIMEAQTRPYTDTLPDSADPMVGHVDYDVRGAWHEFGGLFASSSHGCRLHISVIGRCLIMCLVLHIPRLGAFLSKPH